MDFLKVFSGGALAVWIVGFITISLMVERGLFQIYQTKLWRGLEAGFDVLVKKLLTRLNFSTLNNKGEERDFADLKPWVSIAVCLYIAFSLKLDLPAFFFDSESEPVRIALTGLLLSGGSTSIMWMLRRTGEIRNAAHQVKLNKLNGAVDLKPPETGE